MVNIHRVEFLGEKIVNVAEGQSILEAALEAGIPHFHALHFLGAPYGNSCDNPA